VRKARARRNFTLAKQLQARAPGYKLDHLVRERYPTFLDALRDLDDALCMVHLFATLPGEEGRGVPAAMVQTSRRLVLEWQALMCRSAAMRKAFISVKGFYLQVRRTDALDGMSRVHICGGCQETFICRQRNTTRLACRLQAEVRGQAVTWLVPHSVAQVLPRDVDFRVMLTFLEFYHTLLSFALFKLYHDLGLNYPPVVAPEADAAAAELAAIVRELAGAQGGAVADRARAAAALTRADRAVRTLACSMRLLVEGTMCREVIAGRRAACGNHAPCMQHAC
jgi:pescadillo